MRLFKRAGSHDQDHCHVKSISLFDCLLNVLILTFSVCGISYYLWTLLTGFHSIFIICHVYCSINKHSWAD